jgi:hypothetical protein
MLKAVQHTTSTFYIAIKILRTAELWNLGHIANELELMA